MNTQFTSEQLQKLFRKSVTYAIYATILWHGPLSTSEIRAIFRLNGCVLSNPAGLRALIYQASYRKVLMREGKLNKFVTESQRMKIYYTLLCELEK